MYSGVSKMYIEERNMKIASWRSMLDQNRGEGNRFLDLASLIRTSCQIAEIYKEIYCM